ncbi:MAG: hypothetical protein CVU43_08590 [Chloroflexi bacterium HGW-Chloroflexi-5]|jgi:hypothetical protein|nr:MAG: hypothetical protein CVU43_08590 [Chloroflexi bacterium HGW-Chloroflexi-5]
MLHEPATPAAKDPSGPYKIKLGVRMFIIYMLFYAIFVAINLIFPKAMGMIIFAGLNLVTVYGFALIIFALIEALIYDFLCHKKETFYKKQEESTGEA